MGESRSFGFLVGGAAGLAPLVVLVLEDGSNVMRSLDGSTHAGPSSVPTRMRDGDDDDDDDGRMRSDRTIDEGNPSAARRRRVTAPESTRTRPCAVPSHKRSFPAKSAAFTVSLCSRPVIRTNA